MSLNQRGLLPNFSSLRAAGGIKTLNRLGKNDTVLTDDGAVEVPLVIDAHQVT